MLGRRSPFFVGCQSAVMLGKSTASELVTEAFRPLQEGQPASLYVRAFNLACHSWSALLGHCHQKSLFEPATTRSGVRVPFFVGCHCPAMSGKSEERELVTETFRPAQYGQSVAN